MKYRAIVVAVLVLCVASLAGAQVGGAGVSGLRTHNHSGAGQGGGTLAVSGTLSSTKACQANFTRVAPNYCRTTVFVQAAFTETTTCTLFSPIFSVNAMHLELHWQVLSNNAVAVRANKVNFFNDSGCTNAIGISGIRVFEHVAVAAGSDIAQSTDHLILPSAVYYTTDNLGGNGNAQVVGYRVLGYFD